MHCAWNGAQRVVLVRHDREDQTSDAIQSSGGADPEDQDYILNFVASFPTSTLQEVVEEVSSVLGARVSATTICRVLKRNNFSRKLVSRHALQRCETLRAQFMAEVATAFPPDFFVFIDETGDDKRAQYRRMGYSVLGATAVEHRIFHRGKRWTAFVALSASGSIGVSIQQKYADSQDFSISLVVMSFQK